MSMKDALTAQLAAPESTLAGRLNTHKSGKLTFAVAPTVTLFFMARIKDTYLVHTIAKTNFTKI